MLEQVPIWIKIVGAAVGLLGAFIGLNAAIKKYKLYKKKLALLEDNFENVFIGQFNENELNQALSGYVIPQCSPGDPSNKDGEEYLADLREPIFNYVDRTIENSSRSYHLILADTGMGKTSFCLNYYVHIKQRYKQWTPCLISLTAGDVTDRVKRIENKSRCILIADAFDEDPLAIEHGRERLNAILECASDFRAVIITCRSQYFMSDDAIPRETPLSKLVPRGLNQSQNHGLVRSYISPFSPKEIERYIDGHFPIWKIWKLASRQRAFKLSKSIPDLSYRPMLLERVPDLVKDENKIYELYQLYDYMVEGWIKRESRWIDISDLRKVSFELALYIYEGLPANTGRITKEEIEYISNDRVGVNPNWKHLTARSLLNRDSQGRFKFSHKSILEFLIVRAATEGDDRALEHRWTPFMKELFVSWGHCGNSSFGSKRAQAILSSDAGRLNIAPLYDMWAATATFGAPDFKRSTERRLTHSGQRLAPAAWRAGALEITKRSDKSGWNIYDADFNLNWLLVDSFDFKKEGIQETLGDILRLSSKDNGYSLPSYDQFVSLIEGLSLSKSRIKISGEFFLLSDRPSERGYLVVCVGNGVKNRSGLKLLDKERRVAGTGVLLNTYLTGVEVNHKYASQIKARQLWLVN